MRGPCEPVADATFFITAERCPQMLCRLIGLVAQQDRITSSVSATDTGRILRVTIRVPGMPEHGAAIIAQKMRQLVNVRTVRLR